MILSAFAAVGLWRERTSGECFLTGLAGSQGPGEAAEPANPGVRTAFHPDGEETASPTDGRLDLILAWEAGPRSANAGDRDSPLFSMDSAKALASDDPSAARPDEGAAAPAPVLEILLNQRALARVPLDHPGPLPVSLRIQRSQLLRGVNVLHLRPTSDSLAYPDSLTMLGTLSCHGLRWTPEAKD